MTFVRLHDAARRRLARGADDGYALIFVMLVTMLIMAGVGTMLSVVAANVSPAKHSQDSETALAAAQAGIDDYVAFLNKNCRTFGTAACATIAGGEVAGTVTGADGTGTATFDRQVLNPDSYTSDGFLRVESTGHSGTGTRSLVADLQAVPNFLRFAYYSKYETLSGNYLDTYLPSGRSIAMNSATAKSLAGGDGSVTWSADPNDDTSICDQLYYANADGAGRAAMKQDRTGLPTGTDFEQTSDVGTLYQPCEVTFNSDMSFNGPVFTRDAPYLSYGYNGSTSGPTFTVPAKEDLPPLSTTWSGGGPTYYRSFPIIGGAPSSASSANTVQYRNYPLELPASAPDSSIFTRPCIFTGPTRVLLAGKQATITSPGTLAGQEPTADPNCYTTQNSAGQYVISDYTTTGGGVIYVADQSGSDSTKYTGQTPTAAANTNNTAFYLTAGGAASGPDQSSAVPSSFTQAGAPQTWQVYNPSNNCWAVSRNPNTPNGPKPWEEQTFQCDWFNQMSNKDYTPPAAPNDGYTAYQTAVAADLAKTTPVTIAGNPGSTVTYTVNGGSQQSKTIDCSSAANTTFVPTAASADQLVCLMQHDLRQANTGSNEANWANPAYTNYTHQYIVTNYTQTTTTQNNATVGSTPSIDVGGDPFFDTTTQHGSASTEDATTTTTTFNIASQVYGCYVYGLLGGLLGSPTGKLDLDGSDCTGLIKTGKWAWGDGYYPNQSSPQFQATVAQKTYSDFKQGSQAAAYFPEITDATQYHSSAGGMGDAYVEGTGISGGLSLIAQNDVVVTGALKATTGATIADPATGEPDWTSGGAVDLVAGGNVRLYHPVSCADSTLGSTAAGFCPNDVTGLYSQSDPPTSVMKSDGTLGSAHPSLQYCNMTAATTGGTTGSNSGNSNCSSVAATGSGPVSEIDAAIFALGSSFLTDNYNRGTAISPVTVYGGVYQLHRGATGEKWSSPTTVSSDPPSSGYVMSIQYRNLLPANLPYVPSTSTTDGSDVWSVVSTSSPASGGGS